jgi:Secretion system C-terminal sorting domain
MSKPSICFISIIFLICGSDSLALTCPYIGGNAVYRARNILGMINPGNHYDDLVICNSQGMYKNGESKLQTQLNSLTEAEKQKHLEEVGVILYPNPASSVVTIQYALNENEQADLIFYDILGNKVKEEKLYSNSFNKAIDIDGLASGLYVYQFISTSGKTYFGKIVIE